uniref:Uncharacterized protein n=1 Tax=Rhizophora mucronata TaxID=61149 RepID=A0A2P2N652_RHIMU
MTNKNKKHFVALTYQHSGANLIIIWNSKLKTKHSASHIHHHG